MTSRPRPRKQSLKLYGAGSPAAAPSDPNSSYAKVCELIAPGACVLDAGCGSGELAALLAARGDRVWGVDLNPEAVARAGVHCVAARVADLETTEVGEIFPGQRFDVVVFCDVLEHMREPWRVLESARDALGESGRVVASIPNFGHAAVRLAVLSGVMPYRTIGILDDTHLRFFTRSGIDALFEESGFRVEEVERTVVAFGAASELVPDVRVLRVPAEIERHVREDPESDTLQFVVRAQPLPGVWNMSTLRSRLHDVEALAQEQTVGIRNLERAARARSEEANAQLAQTAAERDATAQRLAEACAQLEALQRALEAAHVRIVEAEAARDAALAQASETAGDAARRVEAAAARADAALARATGLDDENLRLRAAHNDLEGERDAAVFQTGEARAAVREAQARIDEFEEQLSAAHAENLRLAKDGAAALEDGVRLREQTVQSERAQRRRAVHSEAQLVAALAQVEALREDAARAELVRLALEHELAGRAGDGEEFWRDPAATR
jgi:methionine biosynthesis protein MetW